MIELNSLSSEEYIRLRVDAGWGEPQKKDVEAALKQSLAVYVKRINNTAVGAVRIVGDGKLCFYIQDMMVLSEMRRQGIASELMQNVLQYLNRHAAFNAYVGLMAAKGLEPFYQRYGFTVRPNEQMGPGMIMFQGRPGELFES